MVDTYIMWCLRVGARKALLVKSDDAARATGRRKRSLRALLGTCSSPQAGPGTRARHACSCVGRLGTSALGVGEQVRHEARGWVSRSGSRGHRRQTWRHDCVCREAEASWGSPEPTRECWVPECEAREARVEPITSTRQRGVRPQTQAIWPGPEVDGDVGRGRPALWFRSACADSR